MFRPEDQQVEICLLKSNLEEIENELVIQVRNTYLNIFCIFLHIV